MRQPLIVDPDRPKAARGVVAVLVLAVLCVVAGAGEGSLVVLLAAIGWALFFVLCAVQLARTARSRAPMLVADDAGIGSPATGIAVPWGDVVGVRCEVKTTRNATTHTLRVTVRDGHDRLEIPLDDLTMPPAEIAAAVQERFRERVA